MVFETLDKGINIKSLAIESSQKRVHSWFDEKRDIPPRFVSSFESLLRTRDFQLYSMDSINNEEWMPLGDLKVLDEEKFDELNEDQGLQLLISQVLQNEFSLKTEQLNNGSFDERDKAFKELIIRIVEARNIDYPSDIIPAISRSLFAQFRHEMFNPDNMISPFEKLSQTVNILRIFPGLVSSNDFVKAKPGMIRTYTNFRNPFVFQIYENIESNNYSAVLSTLFNFTQTASDVKIILNASGEEFDFRQKDWDAVKSALSYLTKPDILNSGQVVCLFRIWRNAKILSADNVKIGSRGQLDLEFNPKEDFNSEVMQIPEIRKF